jgi:hypothetical protein
MMGIYEEARELLKTIHDLRDALETLVDLQNGPPIHSEKIDWHVAIARPTRLQAYAYRQEHDQ